MATTAMDAVGPLTGGKIHSAPLEGYKDVIFERYIGTGGLVVKTSRGEVKAMSGDVIATFWDKNNKSLIVLVIPAEVFKLLRPEFDFGSEGLTDDEYQKFLDRDNDKPVVKPPTPAPATTSATTTRAR